MKTIRRMEALALLTLCLGASAAHGQSAPETSSAPVPQAVEIGGTTALDLIRLDGESLNIPLRNAGVVRGSESLELDGRKLERGKDYALDHATGTIMLMVPNRKGMILRASYRHDKTLARTGTAPGNQLSNLRLQFSPGASAMVGLGMIERTETGGVLRNDLYALRTNFSGGDARGFGMKGVFALSNRKAVQQSNLMSKGQEANQGPTGQGTAIVQELSGTVAGGRVGIRLQEIDKNFTGLSAFRDSGYTDAETNQFARERGLKRLGFDAKDVNLGGLKLSNGFDSVSDGKNGIQRRSYGVAGNGFRIGFDTRKVDSGFKRFDHLREQDKGQLKYEVGLKHESWFAEFAPKQFALKMQSKAVANGAGKGFHRGGLEFSTGKVKLSYGEQKVDNGFNRLQGVREQDWQQLQREIGLSRKTMSLQLGPVVRQLKSLDIATRAIHADSGKFNAFDLVTSGANWSIEHYARSFDGGFTHLHRLADGEVNQEIAAIAKMYQPTGIGLRGDERNWFFQNAGLSREASRIRFSPGKGLGVELDHLQLRGASDKGTVTSGRLTSGTQEFGFRTQNLGNDFNEMGKLMPFERDRLGNLAGVSRTDVWTNLKFGKDSGLSAQLMRADLREGSTERESLSFHRPGLSLRFNRRKVGQEFGQVGQLIDAEREILQNMVGEEQRQIQLDWMMRKDLQVKLDWSDQENKSLSQEGFLRQTWLNWNPDKFTKLEIFSLGEKVSDDSNLLFDSRVQRMLVSRAIPRFGSMQLEREQRAYEGEGSPSDSTRNTVIVEGQLSETTRLRTEQSATQFENGDRENVSAHTVETSVTKRAGVSVTDTSIRRTGTPRPSERKRNYGFWLDFGGGVRLNYGYNRELNDQANGTLNSQLGLTGGTVGNLTFGNSGYQSQRWDRSRQRSLGNFNLSSTKPFTLGPIRDFRFSLGTDTVRDYDLWQREQNSASVGGELLGVNVSFDYLSQFSPQHRGRAIDRTFRIQTSQDPKATLRANVVYKMRSLPWEKQFDARNINVVARPVRGFELSHSVMTYPEVARADVLLGSVLQPTRSLLWKLDQTDERADTRFGLSWREDLNEQTRQMSRLANLDVTFFSKSPSPLKLNYGLEQADQNGTRRTLHRYGIQFSQRPGPNSLFNITAGNVSWQHGRQADIRRENWSLRLEWQVKF